MNKRIDALRDEGGFTLVEVLVAVFVLLLGVLGAVTMLNTANAETSRNKARNGATNLVRDIIEASRALPYEQANPTVDASGNADNTIITALQNMPPGNSGPAAGSSFADSNTGKAGWQVRRGEFEYTVTVQACVVDDAKDKVVGAHSPANADGSGYYCPNLPITPTGDTSPDDYRRINVTASWTTNSCNSCSQPTSSNSAKTYSVTQTGVIVNPTGGLGPQAIGDPVWTNTTGCHTGTVSQTFAPSATSAFFQVTDPAGTNFSASVPTVDPSTGNKTFSFTYDNASTPDNSYPLTITGFNSNGQPTIINTFIYINCNPPGDPSGLSGGFDWRRCTAYPANCAAGQRIFDMDWNPSPGPDADIVGYYVWRVNGAADWTELPNPPVNPDTKVACVSRTQATTTTIPGSLDFLEPFQPSCYDTALLDALNRPLPALLDILSGQTADYWVQAVDPQPTNNISVAPTGVRTSLANHSGTLHVIENMLNVRPTSPALTVSDDGGQPCLSWTDSTDLTATGLAIVSPIRFYRIYRDTTTVATVTVTVNSAGGGSADVQVQNVPYTDRMGRATPNAGGSCDTANPTRSWFKDTTAGSTDRHYWVTAVDQQYLESFPSNEGVWNAP